MSAVSFKSAYIQSVGYARPPLSISSAHIEERLAPLYDRLRLSAGRLELMSGVRSRGVWPTGTLPSNIATQAARNCLEGTGAAPDLLIFASVCRDYLEPASAAFVHRDLGLSSSCAFMDLGNACLGIMHGAMLASQLIDAGSIRQALVVGGENSGPLLENTLAQLLASPDTSRAQLKLAFANLTLGSGGAALLVGRHPLGDRPALRLVGGALRVDSGAAALCRGDGDPRNLSMQTDSEALLLAGIRLAQETWEAARGPMGFLERAPDALIVHQVGEAHERALRTALALSDIPGPATYSVWGNTGSTALPIALATYQQAGAQELNGKRAALLGIGSGLSCLMLAGEWNV